MRTNQPIFLAACFTMISGCHDSETPRKEATALLPTATSEDSSRRNNIPLQPNTSLSKAIPPQMPDNIKHLIVKVQGERVGAKASSAILAMHELLRHWSPVGMTTIDVKVILGEPSEEDQAKLIYRFDDGNLAYEWSLLKNGESIASMSKMLHE